MLIQFGEPLPKRIDTQIPCFRVITVEAPMAFLTLIIHTSPYPPHETIRVHDGKWANATMFDAERVHAAIVTALESRQGEVWDLIAEETVQNTRLDARDMVHEATLLLRSGAPSYSAPAPDHPMCRCVPLDMAPKRTWWQRLRRWLPW